MKRTAAALKNKKRLISDLRDGEGCSVFIEDDMIYYMAEKNEYILENVPIPEVQDHHKSDKPYAYIEQTADGIFVFIDIRFNEYLIRAITSTSNGYIESPFLVDGVEVVSVY